MAHLSDEDARACGLVRKSDTGWEPAARVLGTVAAAGIAFALTGPVGFLATTALLVEKTYQGRDRD